MKKLSGVPFVNRLNLFYLHNACVILSICVCHKSEFCRKGWADWTDVLAHDRWGLPSTYLVVLCYEIWNLGTASTKIRTLPFGTWQYWQRSMTTACANKNRYIMKNEETYLLLFLEYEENKDHNKACLFRSLVALNVFTAVKYSTWKLQKFIMS